MLRCSECGKETRNLCKINCECGGLIEVIPHDLSDREKEGED